MNDIFFYIEIVAILGCLLFTIDALVWYTVLQHEQRFIRINSNTINFIKDQISNDVKIAIVFALIFVLGMYD